jgi:hypothetical protein
VAVLGRSQEHEAAAHSGQIRINFALPNLEQASSLELFSVGYQRDGGTLLLDRHTATLTLPDAARQARIAR